MTPKGQMIALIHALRDQTPVESPVRKIAHDLDSSGAIILTRDKLEFVAALLDLPFDTYKRLEQELWK